MPLKTYALFDVIGVKQAFASGNAAALLEAFWRAADVWTNGVAQGFGPMRVLGRNAVQSPDVVVTTFSDSALLSTETEFELGDFWRLVDSLKAKIDQAAGASYVIVNRDTVIGHHASPALGMSVVGGSMVPSYSNAGGSGPAFVNLFLAEQQIRRQVQQHGWGRYSVYAIGPATLPPAAQPATSVQFTGLGGTACDLYALR